MMMNGRYDFGGGAPEPKYRLKMPEVKHIKAEALRGDSKRFARGYGAARDQLMDWRGRDYQHRPGGAAGRKRGREGCGTLTST